MKKRIYTVIVAIMLICSLVWNIRQLVFYVPMYQQQADMAAREEFFSEQLAGMEKSAEALDEHTAELKRKNEELSAQLERQQEENNIRQADLELLSEEIAQSIQLAGRVQAELDGLNSAKDIMQESIVQKAAWSGESIFGIYCDLSVVPKQLLQSFVREDFKLILSNTMLQEKDGERRMLDGIFSGAAGEGERFIELIEEHSPATLLHEMGHFLAYSKGLYEDGESLEQLYVQQKNAVPVSEEEFFAGKGLREYSYEDRYEYLADAFYLYCRYPDVLKEKYPQMYTYINEMLME